MNKLRSIIAGNRLYFLLYAAFFIIGLVFLLRTGKAGSFVYLNPYHEGALDTFFAYFTLLGDGFLPVIIFLIFLFMRRYWQATQLMAAFLVSALLAQILKNLFSMPRPKQFFTPGTYPYFIDGITHTGFASFPSGHSTSVFALATILALVEKDKKWNVAYLLGAVAVGYSRIYLGQHFLPDVLAGSLIGVLTALGIHWLFATKFQRMRGFA